MFDDIGGKIKGFAKANFIVLAIASFIGFIVFAGAGDSLIGLLILLGGVFTALVGSWFLYGFGQLVENSDIIRENLEKKE